MADRHVLLIDADDAFANLLRTALSPYSIAVDVTADGTEGLQRAKDYGPEVLLIAVELPDKAGYATCNKAKRGGLNHLPVVLASRSVPWADLEQHRKLRYRADDYIDKRRASASDVLACLGGLVQLGDPTKTLAVARAESHIDIDMDSDNDAETTSLVDFSSEVAIDESSPGNKLQPGGDPRTFSSEDIDRETDAAFGALLDDKSGPSTDPGSVRLPGIGFNDSTATNTPRPAFREVLTGAPPGPDDQGLDDTPQPEDSPVITVTPFTPTPLPFPVAATPPTPPAPEPARAASRRAPSGRPVAQPVPAGGDGLLAAVADAEKVVEEERSQSRSSPMATRLNELEQEAARLRRELEEARRFPASSTGTGPTPTAAGGGREREFLNLREVINRKEKEALDLKEQLDGRERQLVTTEERARDGERRSAELETARRELETQLREVQEATAALLQDKERGGERERGLKSRLDAAQGEVRKAHEEHDALRKRLAQAEEAAGTDVARVEERFRRETAARISQLEADHALVVQRAAEAHRNEVAALEARAEEDRGISVAAADAGRLEELERLRREHAGAVERLEAGRLAEREQLVRGHEEALARKDRERKEMLQRAHEEREAMLSAAEEQRQGDLADLEERRTVEITDLQRRADELRDAAESRHAQALAEARRHADEALTEARRNSDEALATARRAHEGALADVEARRQADIQAATESAAAARKSADEELSVLADQNRLRIEELERGAAARAAADAEVLAMTRGELGDLRAAKAAAEETATKALADADARRERELEAAAAHEAQALEERRQAHADEVTELGNQRAAVERDLAGARERIATLEAETQRLGSIMRTLEKATEGYQRDIEAKDKRLAELDAARQDLEREVLGTQEQVLRAHQRIKSDESIVDRAKKAMAVALTLLDREPPAS